MYFIRNIILSVHFITITLLSSSLYAQYDDLYDNSPYDSRYLTVFEIKNDQLIKKFGPDENITALGIASWNRIKALFPFEYRREIIQYNVMRGRRWAGFFSGDGENDMGRTGYRLAIAKYLLLREQNIHDPVRPITGRRATLDWTLIHEMGHYICLRSNAIELFSQSFDGDTVPQPPRRKRPMDYPKDGSPVTNGNFVTSYAERTPGDEEVVETFTTYMTLKELPTNDSLVAKKIRFFNTLKGFPELRKHIQSLSVQ